MQERKGTLYLKHTQLVIHWTDGREESFRLGEVTRIGRGRNGNDIAIPEVFQSVSRRHLEIRSEKDGYRIIDLGSRNGVLVNGIYAKDTYLRDGDEIRLGQDDQGHEIRIEFQLGSETLLTELRSDEQPTIPPSGGLASESPLNTPHLKIRWHNGRTNYFPIHKDRIVIGRGPDADLPIPESLRFISSQHVEIVNRDGGFLVRDLNSTNGTLLNNQRLQPGQYYPLVHEAILRFGDEEYGVSVGFTFFHSKSQSQSTHGFLQSAPATEITKGKQILIGRLPNCSIVLDHSEVSRRHAMIRQTDNRYFIEDLNSSNGTLVNDQPVRQVQLHDGDVIQISTFLLLFEGGQLVPYQSSGMRLDINGLSKYATGKNGARRILDRVNLTVLPREFVALVGGRAAGISTLLDALLGIRRGSGQVRLNGHDFYKEYDRLRSQVGYVPTADILHADLTVELALDYVARLRLPASLTADERRSRIEAALETVSLHMPDIHKTRVSDLSEEQRKRLSIAVELLADPKLIYLEAATAGLDPGLEKKMMHTLRRVADEGRTVILSTAATNNIFQTDQVAFFSEGKLVYFGPPEEMRGFFEAEEFADIYESTEGKGEEWRRVFEEKKPQQFKTYVDARQKSLSATARRPLPKTGFSIAAYFRQFFVLTQRAWSILASNPTRLFLALSLLPMAAILQLIIARSDILTGNLAILADPVAASKTVFESYMPLPDTAIFIFLMGLEAFLAGLFLPSGDLIKERSIFLRERMVNLKVLPYVSSKIFLYSVLAAIQVLLYLIVLSFGVDFPKNGLYFSGQLELFFTLFLTMMAGVSFGLLISAMSRSTVVANYILTGVLFFQLFFGGALFGLRGSSLESLSYLSVTRWSTTALGVTIDMNRIAQSTIVCDSALGNSVDPNSAMKTVCFNSPGVKDHLQLNYGNEQLTGSWAMLIWMSIFSLLGTWFLLRRQN